jgi:hypothetical protein
MMPIALAVLLVAAVLLVTVMMPIALAALLVAAVLLVTDSGTIRQRR